MTAAATNVVATSGSACAATWVYTEGVGYAAKLPDGRTAYISPSRRRPGKWALKIVRKPGARGLADFYLPPKDTPEECQRVAEYQGRTRRAA